jgi:hypothetical protein
MQIRHREEGGRRCESVAMEGLVDRRVTKAMVERDQPRNTGCPSLQFLEEIFEGLKRVHSCLGQQSE